MGCQGLVQFRYRIVMEQGTVYGEGELLLLQRYPQRVSPSQMIALFVLCVTVLVFTDLTR